MIDSLPLILNGLGMGSAFALVALGFSFVVKTTNSFNFAQGTLVPIGALLAYTSSMVWGLPAILSLVFVLVITALLGAATERVAVYPLVKRGDPPLLWLMSTLGVSVILSGLAVRLWGSIPQAVDPYVGDRTITIAGSPIATSYLIAFVVAIVVAVAIVVFERFTRWGRTMRAIADNREAVKLSGVNVLAYSLAAYMIGAALAGLAGFIVAPVTFASSSGGFQFTIIGFAAMAMGGFGNHWGALIGGWLVGLIQSVGGALFGLQYQSALVFITLLIILLIRPSGLFSSRKARTV